MKRLRGKGRITGTLTLALGRFLSQGSFGFLGDRGRQRRERSEGAAASQSSRYLLQNSMLDFHDFLQRTSSAAFIK